MIKLSSGKPVQRNEDGARVFGNSREHSVLLLLLVLRHVDDVGPDELSSPWRDRPEVRSGRKTKDEYISEVYEGLDLVPPEVIGVVIDEFRQQGRIVKPSAAELQTACRAAMQATEDLSGLV